MKLKQKSSWITYEEMIILVTNELIRSWLIENGPITKRISAKENFTLNLIRDEIDEVDEIDKKYLGNIIGDIKIREVILLGNKVPKVYAKSLIPVQTIEKGFSKLGSLGSKPLGDILFEKDIFNKIDVVYSTFTNELDTFWGRKTKYTVKNLPFSVMEIFLIDE
tara:strand:- start:109 stop:600 length:492 start_codon:yes stop_codon:yes gene_type:complete